MDRSLLVDSATQLAVRIRTGALTSRAVVEAHLAQLERVNPHLNAVVATRFDEARAEADAADRRLAEEGPDGLPPFHGVPCTIKECFALVGMPHTAGLVARRGVRASEDATTVARLRRAGAIPLGVTNTSELCMWMESSNRLYGRTNNPYDLGRIVGGSSGGEGAIVASGASPFGLGSDIGGSIRMPAFFNGVFGHKPTGGLVPGSGQFPMAHGVARRYLTTGPLTRRAEDLYPLLALLAGPDGLDGECHARELRDPARVSLSSLHVIDVPDNGLLAPTDELRRAQERALAALAQAGARTSMRRFDALRRSFLMWSSALTLAGGPTFAELLGNGQPVRAGRELVRWALRRSDHTLPALLLAILEKAPALSPSKQRALVDSIAILRDELVAAMGPNGVLLYPSYPEPAPRHYAPLVPRFKWVYTAILNVLELPVTQVPLGLNSDGLPLGVQVVGPPGRDDLTLACALELERRLGGWVPPARWLPEG
jgi:fatty acid amide hydrolase 2